MDEHMRHIWHILLLLLEACAALQLAVLVPPSSLATNADLQGIGVIPLAITDNVISSNVDLCYIELTENSLENFNRVQQYLAVNQSVTTAVYFPNQLRDAYILAALFDDAGVPILSTHVFPLPNAINIKIPAQAYLRAAMDVIKAVSWNTTLIVYSSAYDEVVKDVNSIMQAKGVKVEQTYRFDSLYFESISSVSFALDTSPVRVAIIIASLADVQTFIVLLRDTPTQLIWIDPDAQLPTYHLYSIADHINTVDHDLIQGFITITPPLNHTKWENISQRLQERDSELYSTLDGSAIAPAYDAVSLWVNAIETVIASGGDANNASEVKQVFLALGPRDDLITTPHYYNNETSERNGLLRVLNFRFYRSTNSSSWVEVGNWFESNGLELNINDIVFADGTHNKPNALVEPTITIGLLWSSDDIAKYYDIAQLAVEHVNNNKSLLPGFQLRAVVDSDGGTLSGAILAAIRLVGRLTTTIIGPSRSDFAQAVQYYVGGMLMPCVSPFASADGLSDKAAYPSFLRTVIAEIHQTHTMMGLVRHFQWQRVCILFHRLDYGTHIADLLTEQATSSGLHVTRIAFSFNTTDFSSSFDTIVESRCVVILAIVHGDHLPHLIPQARLNRKLFATPGMTWIFSEHVYPHLTDNTFWAQHVIPRNVLEGVFVTNPLASPPDNPLYDNFIQELRSRNMTEPGVHGTFVYDAIQMVAIALDSTLRQGMAPFGGSLLANLYNTSFMGVSGPVSVDSNGDRVGGTYGVFNFQTSQNGFVLVGVHAHHDVHMLADPIFSDGTKNIPRDYQRPILYLKYNSGAVALAVIAAVALVIYAISAVGVIIHRTNRLIRRSSPVFLLVILFGLSLNAISIFFWLDYPTPSYCHARVWFGFVGCAVAYGALLAKNARLYYLFNEPSMRIIAITNTQLLQYLFLLVSPLLIALVLWSTLAPYEVVFKDAPSGWEQFVVCRSENDTTFATISFVYLGILFIIGTILSFKTRKLPDTFKESWFIALATYNLLLVAVLMITLRYILAYDAIASSVITCAGFLMGGITTWALLFLPKYYAVYFRKQDIDEWSTTATSKNLSLPSMSMSAASTFEPSNSSRNKSINKQTSSVSKKSSSPRSEGSTRNDDDSDSDGDSNHSSSK